MLPSFNVIPIIQNRDNVRLGFLSVDGVSTRHDSTSTDGGRLYFDATPTGGGWSLNLFNDYARTVGSQVLTGSGPLGSYFSLAAANGSGLSGRARLDGAGSAPLSGIAVVTFATDPDVIADPSVLANFPGYDATYGMAAFHAAAMKRLLTSDLPAAVPELYRGKRISAFAPLSAGAELPDLTGIENPEALRDAQADLVKALSAKQYEHLEEWAEMARLARERFAVDLAQVAAANAPQVQEQAAQAVPTVQFGTFVRN